MPKIESLATLGDMGVTASDFDARTADKVSPENVGVKATVAPLPAVTDAGVRLSFFVLKIAAGAIAFFSVYLFVVELIGRNNLGEAYKHVYSQVESSGDFIDTNGISAINEEFRTAGDNFQLSKDEASALNEFSNSVRRAKIVSENQFNLLKNCETSGDRPGLQNCSDILGVALKAAVSSSYSVEKVRALTDFVKTVDEQQRGFEGFWLQAAQLVLLNLLLPLLTGLFGYIFGTTKGSAELKEKAQD